MVEILISGSNRRLHGEYHHIENSRSVALVLAPQPKFGATMNNKVTVSIYQAFVNNNFSTLRINYSGVGCSEGKVSTKDSDLLKDANAAIEWLQSHHPLVDFFWVGGFSSGAWLALNLVMRRPEISAFIAVSPPLKLHDFSFLVPCTVPGLIIQGSNDRLCEPNELIKLTTLIKKRVKHFKLEFIPNGDYRMNSNENLETIFNLANTYLGNAPSYICEDSEPKEILSKELQYEKFRTKELLPELSSEDYISIADDELQDA